jgi:predicted TIM-barrel fold metal-dependent hydrolase
LLERHGLLLELLMNPWQAQAVADFAADVPELTIVVNHCCTPLDRDEAGIRRWRDGLAAMGRAPNVHIKLSNFARYAAEPTPPAAREVLMPCIDAFGAERCLWGSDYPVARRDISYAGALDLFRHAVAMLPRQAQRAMLHDNAARLYGLAPAARA